MTKEQVMAMANEFINTNKLDKAKYTQEAHCALLLKVMIHLCGPMDDAKKLELLETFAVNGFGANHSQFKQALFRSEKAAEAGADRLSAYKV